MTIDRTYPIFTVRWLAIHGLGAQVMLLKIRSSSSSGLTIPFPFSNSTSFHIASLIKERTISISKHF